MMKTNDNRPPAGHLGMARRREQRHRDRTLRAFARAEAALLEAGFTFTVEDVADAERSAAA